MLLGASRSILNTHMDQMRIWRDLCEARNASLPEDVVVAFRQLGDMQRGAPERAMLRVQHIMGGGVLNPVVEHVGDITHRMTHKAEWNDGVHGYDKVAKTYRWLTHPYGFEKEMQENITNNARYREVSRAQLVKELHAALQKYAQEHAKLPVYNDLQWLARQAAIFVGLEEFGKAAKCLKMILDQAPDEETFQKKSLEFTRNEDGSLKRL